MQQRKEHGSSVVALFLGISFLLAPGSGCQGPAPQTPHEARLNRAIETYCAQRALELERAHRQQDSAIPLALSPPGYAVPGPASGMIVGKTEVAKGVSPPSLGMFAQDPTATAPTSQAFLPPDGYWRKDVWHQIGHEAKELAVHDFWRGFKTSYWNVPNALLLTATMGASIAIRGTDVDDTIRNRTHGSRALGDMSEAIQILGHPATHFGAAGVLWLGSTLTRDVKEHEVAKALTQALAVNGVSTLLLKVSTNTRAPDGERFAWPSGHTSSAFTAAAVLNEYYGPWVGLPSLALAGLVGYQRIDSRTHDFSDVVFGAMLGYVIGSSIAKDDKARFPELFGMQVIPYADPETGTAGLALLKRW